MVSKLPSGRPSGTTSTCQEMQAIKNWRFLLLLHPLKVPKEEKVETTVRERKGKNLDRLLRSRPVQRISTFSRNFLSSFEATSTIAFTRITYAAPFRRTLAHEGLLSAANLRASAWAVADQSPMTTAGASPTKYTGPHQARQPLTRSSGLARCDGLGERFSSSRTRVWRGPRSFSQNPSVRPWSSTPFSGEWLRDVFSSLSNSVLSLRCRPPVGKHFVMRHLHTERHDFVAPPVSATGKHTRVYTCLAFLGDYEYLSLSKRQLGMSLWFS